MRRRIGQKSKQKLNKILMNLGNGFKKVIKSQRVNGRLPLVDSGSQERSGQMFTIEIIFFRAGEKLRFDWFLARAWLKCQIGFATMCYTQTV